MIKTILAIILSVSIFGLILFVFVKNQIKKRILLQGDLPSSSKAITGCVFNTRCNKVNDKCFNEEPAWSNYQDEHWVACHNV